MAKSKLSWSLTDSTLAVEVLATKTKVTFDIAKLFPKFMEMSDVQQRTIANGLKQKLADHLARPTDMALTPQEMVVELNALWERLCSGHWNMEGKGTSRVKVSELKAQVVEKDELLAEMDMKLAEAQALIDKLTKTKTE